MNVKAFDCGEMKNRIQAERLAEYETRKEEVVGYDILHASKRS